MKYAAALMIAVVSICLASKASAGSPVNKCWFEDSHMHIMDATGHVLEEINYHLDYEFCSNGREITSVRYVTAFGAGNWPWSFKDNVRGNPNYENHPNTYTTVIFSQGLFEACILNWSCVRSRQPWIRVVLYASGRVDMKWSNG